MQAQIQPVSSATKATNKMKSDYIPIGDHPLTNADFKNIVQLLNRYPLESVTIGDAGKLTTAKLVVSMKTCQANILQY